MKASTTGNVTGVYDLSGGIDERISGYISNGNSKLYSSGSSGSSGGLMGGTSEANPNGYLTLSTRDYTIYPYSSSSDSRSNNYDTYKGLLTSMYGYGDAILETSSRSDTHFAWNSDDPQFVSTSNPFFERGGYSGDSGAGLFNFNDDGGTVHLSCGFRVVIIAE